MKTQDHGNNEKSYHVNVATRQKISLIYKKKEDLGLKK